MAGASSRPTTTRSRARRWGSTPRVTRMSRSAFAPSSPRPPAYVTGTAIVPRRQPLILLALIVPLLCTRSGWFATGCQRYEIPSERIKVSTGLLSRQPAELELYRVRDYSVVEPFALRLVGCGN